MAQTAVEKNRAVARIDVKACKKCGICQAICPFNAFSSNAMGEIEMSNSESCKGCGQCVSLCPDYALSLDVVH